MSFKTVELRRIATIVNGGTPTPSAENWGGGVPWATPVDLGRVNGGILGGTERTLTAHGVATGSTVVPPGSVLLSTRAPIGYTAIARSAVAFNQGCKALVPRVGVDSRFLRYAVQASETELVAAGRGSTFQEVNGADVAAHRVSIAATHEQRQIADYLDHEAAEIDAFIADLHALKAGLNEHRMAELAGLLSYPGDVFRADSSTLTPLKRLGSITLGKMLDPARSTDDTRWPYLRAANVQPLGRLELADVKTMRFTPAERACLDIKAGDVLIVEGGHGGYGRAAYVSADLPGTGFQNSIVRFRPAPTTDGRYVAYALQLLRHSGYIKTVASVTSMPHFTAEKVAIAPVPRVTLERQREVADALDLRWAEIDEAIDDIDAAIALAKERRAALITAAVTGQIDVTTKGSREHADL